MSGPCRQKLALISVDPPYRAGRRGVLCSLATRTLAASLEQTLGDGRIETVVVDIPRLATPERALDLVLRHDPDVAGFSTYIWNSARHFALADALRKANRRTYTVFGGPQMSYDAAEMAGVFAAHPGIDLVVQGEGEQALAALLTASPRRRPGRGTRLVGASAGELAAFSAPLFERYPAHARLAYLDVECTRGCRRRCAYCNIPERCRQIRARPMNHVSAEIGWALRRGLSSVSYAAAGLQYLPGYLPLLLRTIRAADPRGVLAHQGEVDYWSLTPEDAALFAGLDFTVGMGLQSTSAAANRLMHRTFDRRRFEAALERLRRNGVTVDVEVMLGLPGDTREDFRRTLAYALSLDAPLIVFVLLVLPGTEFYVRRAALGIEFDPGRAHRVVHTGTMSASEVDEAVEHVREVAAREQARGRKAPILLIAEAGAEELIIREPRPARGKPRRSPARRSSPRLSVALVARVTARLRNAGRRAKLPPGWSLGPLREQPPHLVLELRSAGRVLRVGFAEPGGAGGRFATDGGVDISYLVGEGEPDPLRDEGCRAAFAAVLSLFRTKAEP